MKAAALFLDGEPASLRNSLPSGWMAVDMARERAGDGAVLRELDDRRRALDRPVVLVGVGRGASQALLALGALGGFAGGVLFRPVLVRRTLSETEPAQPLDVVPGLRVPVQLHFRDGDPEVPGPQIEILRERLARAAVPHQVFVYGGEPDRDPAAVVRAIRFLERAIVAPHPT